jgi:hypothetical protein
MENSKLTKTEKARQVMSKVKSMLIIFFDIKGIVHEEFVLAGQTAILHTTVTFYSGFIPNFGDKRTGHCTLATHRFTLPFSPGNFCKKQHDCCPPPTRLA